jgi:hypothetical protein
MSPRQTAIVFGAVGFAVVGLACGGGGLAGDAGAPGDGASVGEDLTTPSGFCHAYATHFGRAQFACAGGHGGPPSFSDDKCGALDGALASKQITFDATKAAACIAEVDGNPVSACLNDSPCLTTVIGGLVPDGQACSHWMECAPVSSCVGDDMACTQPICTRYGLPLGAPCGGLMDLPCNFGLQCAQPAAGGEGTCVTQPAGAPCATDSDCVLFSEFCDGAACQPRFALGASCATNATGCVLLAACDATTNVCVAAGTIGQSCGPLSVCWDGYCDTSATGPPGSCSAYLATGAACTDANACASGVCVAGACADCRL